MNIKEVRFRNSNFKLLTNLVDLDNILYEYMYYIYKGGNMGKKGLTLITLIVYIVVVLFLAGVSIPSIIKNKKVANINEDIFRSTVNGYIDKLDSTVNEYILRNRSFPMSVIESNEILNYIPSMSLDHTSYFVIHERMLKYIENNVTDNMEKEYLQKMYDEGIIAKYMPVE